MGFDFQSEYHTITRAWLSSNGIEYLHLTPEMREYLDRCRNWRIRTKDLIVMFGNKFKLSGSSCGRLLVEYINGSKETAR